jgi:hypothetical protein
MGREPTFQATCTCRPAPLGAQCHRLQCTARHHHSAWLAHQLRKHRAESGMRKPPDGHVWHDMGTLCLPACLTVDGAFEHYGCHEPTHGLRRLWCMDATALACTPVQCSRHMNQNCQETTSQQWYHGRPCKGWVPIPHWSVCTDTVPCSKAGPTSLGLSHPTPATTSEHPLPQPCMKVLSQTYKHTLTRIRSLFDRLR